MARSNPKPTTRQGDQPKAGKKKNYKAPPPVNKDKQDRRILGDQQFVSKVNFTEEVQTIRFRDGKMISDVKHVPIPYKYDPTRKHLVYNSFYEWGKASKKDKNGV